MPSFSLVTYGCQMNQHDSERIGELLRERGHAPAAGLTLADIVVVNTCSVRDKAEQKLMSDLGRLSRLKRRRPGLTLVVAGCVKTRNWFDIQWYGSSARKIIEKVIPLLIFRKERAEIGLRFQLTKDKKKNKQTEVIKSLQQKYISQIRLLNA